MTSAARSVAAVLSMWVCVAACGALDVTPGGPTPPGVGTPPDGTRCVLFGGNDVLDRDPHATPWGWLGTTWSSLPSDYAPSPRSDLGSAVLGTSIVFFGGWPHETISDLQETWVLTAGEWTQANPDQFAECQGQPRPWRLSMAWRFCSAAAPSAKTCPSWCFMIRGNGM